MTEVYLALGSNIKRTASLVHAVKRLSGVLVSWKCSRVYRSVPHNNARGPEFFNAVIAGCTDLSLPDLFNFTKAAEAEMGRENWISPEGETFSLRCLDIDILTYGDTVSVNPELPRSDLTNYSFVIQPVLELKPDFRMPGRDGFLRELADPACLRPLPVVPELDLELLSRS
ncbi:2-amino-4-hydroxy-6-hydroxymethyldihydropteridine diphosphokinase [Succinimonas amylolytica]|uniref:2-amino-4-hydroxy-6- hydroxymethyldihydropteridine diphosphokinase n=1 Tax=Succinimonas amylolytica TaxID=83769 RepID=UPI0003614F87|nr:2-amino-4-hydroxy-6-hydroxymethyldihydropteridine diphosphokinase [Succinimonas amylolytica]